MELNLTHAVIFSENLRQKFLRSKPPMMRSRRQLFRSYPNTIVGCEIVNWILKETSTDESQHESNNNEECDKMNEKSEIITENMGINLETVSRALQNLVEFGILHSIQGECPFKADSTFYRFTTDDSACSGVVEALAKGFRLHESTLCPNCSLLQCVCEYGELISDKCMRGGDLIHWVIEHDLASHQEDAKRVCQLMLDHGILKPATKQVTEFDPRLFYLFGIDFSAPSMTIQDFIMITNSFQSSATDSTSSLCESSDGKVNHIRQASDQLMDLSMNEQNKAGRTKNVSSSSFGSDDSGYDCDSHPGISPVSSDPQMSFSSLLTREGQMTLEALSHPNAPFFKKELRIYPDPVGYGFIIRGSSPCYVKIVDPESPAGKAGLKAKQYITDINNCDVTKRCHTEIEDLILNGPKFLKIIVMCPKEDCDEYIQFITNSRKTSEAKNTLSQTQPEPCLKYTGRRQSAPIKSHTTWPSAQPWMKNSRKASDFGVILTTSTAKIIH